MVLIRGSLVLVVRLWLDLRLGFNMWNYFLTCSSVARRPNMIQQHNFVCEYY